MMLSLGELFESLLTKPPEPLRPPSMTDQEREIGQKQEESESKTPFLSELGLSPEDAARRAMERPGLWTMDELDCIASVLNRTRPDLKKLDDMVREQILGLREPKVEKRKEAPAPLSLEFDKVDVEHHPVIREPDVAALPSLGMLNTGVSDRWWEKK